MKRKEVETLAERIIELFDGLTFAEARRVMMEVHHRLYEEAYIASRKESRKSREAPAQS